MRTHLDYTSCSFDVKAALQMMHVELMHTFGCVCVCMYDCTLPFTGKREHMMQQ